jgi:carbamoylphosphate synthase large subunit
MFPEVDPILGPEMRSTGEVLGLAKNYGEAFYKAQEGTGNSVPLSGTVLFSVNTQDKKEFTGNSKKDSTTADTLLWQRDEHMIS